MAKTTLKPWSEENFQVLLSHVLYVEVETTEVLTKEEEAAVSRGIRTAFSWCFKDEEWPSLGEIKNAIEKFNPTLAEKLISKKYCLIPRWILGITLKLYQSRRVHNKQPSANFKLYYYLLTL